MSLLALTACLTKGVVGDDDDDSSAVSVSVCGIGLLICGGNIESHSANKPRTGGSVLPIDWWLYSLTFMTFLLSGK